MKERKNQIKPTINNPNMLQSKAKEKELLQANEIFLIEEDYLNKKGCTSITLGPEEIEQPCYICTICNPLKDHYICKYCFMNCHQICRDNFNCDLDESSSKLLNLEFACHCGIKLKHKPEKPTKKELIPCTMLQLDLILNINPLYCNTHQQTICCICAVACHKTCRVTHCIESEDEMINCLCDGEKHTSFNEIALTFPLDDYKLRAGVSVWAIQILNILFGNKNTFLKLSTLFSGVINGVSTDEETKKMFYPLLELFSNTFNRKFKTFYYHEAILNMFNFQNLIAYMKGIQTIDAPTILMKFRLMFVVLFIHLRKDFQMIKSLTSVDFLTDTILERIEFKKILSKPSIFTTLIDQKYNLEDLFKEGNVLKSLVLDDVCKLMELGVDYVSIEENQDEFEIGLKYLCFMLKRMMFAKGDLVKLINSLYKFHSKFFDYINSEKNNIYSLLDIFSGLVELFYMITVSYNDIIVMEYLDNTNIEKAETEDINGFIHEKSDHGELLFKMVLKNCDVVKKHYSLIPKPDCTTMTKEEMRRKKMIENEKKKLQERIEAKTTGVKVKLPPNGGLLNEKIIKLFNETLKMFSLADNIYFKQFTSIKKSDLVEYYAFTQKINEESFESFGKLKDGKSHYDPFYNVKLTIEAKLHDLFSSSYSEENITINYKIFDTLMFFSNEMKSRFELYEQNEVKPSEGALDSEKLKSDGNKAVTYPKDNGKGKGKDNGNGNGKGNKKDSSENPKEEPENQILKKKLEDFISKIRSYNECYYGFLQKDSFLIYMEDFVDCLIISNLDETLSKVLVFFSDRTFPNLLHFDLLDAIFSFLSMYFLTKRGMRYFFQGKNISRLNKIFNRFCCKVNNKNINGNLGKEFETNIKTTTRILAFISTMMKGAHVYDLNLKDHKVLLRFKNIFFEHLEQFSPISKDSNCFNVFKEHLSYIMKIFYRLSNDYEYEDYEEIKKRIITIFYTSPWNLLDGSSFTAHFTGLNESRNEKVDTSFAYEDNDNAHGNGNGNKGRTKRKDYDEESNNEQSKLLLNDNKEALSALSSLNKKINYNGSSSGSGNGSEKKKKPIYRDNKSITSSRKGALSLYFAFFNLISKRTYATFCQEDELVLLQSLTRFSDLKDYKILFETNQLTLKQKTILLQFCRTYYFIDYLHQYNIFQQRRQLTTLEFKQLIESNTIVEQNIGEYLMFNDVIDLPLEKIKQYQEKYNRINQIEIVIQLYITELRNFPNQLVNEDLGYIEKFYPELLFGIKFISNFFYLEKEIWSKLNLTFYELTLEFLPKIQLFKTVFKEMIEVGKIVTLTEPPSEEINQIMNKLTSTSFNIYDKKEIFKHFSEGIEDIFNTTQINQGCSLSKYLDVFDNMAEANFTPFSLIETLDYEYFYEEESEEAERELMKDPLYCKLKTIKDSFINTFIDITNTNFLSVISTISNETVMIDYRQKIVDYFQAYLNSIDISATYKLEGLLCIITKMLFYDGDEMQSRFENLIYDKFFFTNFNRLLNQNIVLTIALSRNFFAFDRAITIINLTKLIIQFLQALGEGFNTAYHDNIFKFQSEIKCNVDQDDKSENSYQSDDDYDDVLGGGGAGDGVAGEGGSDEDQQHKPKQINFLNVIHQKLSSYDTTTTANVPQIEITKTLYESVIHNLKRTYFFLELDSLIDSEMPYDKLIILTTNFIDFLIEYIQTTEDKEDKIKKYISELLFGMRRKETKDIYEVLDYKGVLDVLFIKIKPNEASNKRQYLLRKKVICYVKIKYLQLLISYLQTGNKEAMVDKLINKRCSPIELYQEILYNFQQLLSNLKQKDEKLYVNLIKLKSDAKYVHKLIYYYSHEKSFRDIIEFPVILKYYILIKTFEDIYSQYALRDHFIKMRQEENYIDNDAENEESFGIRSRFSKRVHMFLEEIVLKIEIRKGEGNDDDDENDNSNKIAKMVLRKMNKNTANEVIEEDNDEDDDGGNNNSNNQISFFVRPYLTFFLSDHSKKSFEDKVDRTNATSKFIELINYSDYCLFEMVVNSHTIGRSKFLLWMSEIDFFYIELFNYLIIIAQNCLIMVHYYRSPSLPSNLYDVVDNDLLLEIFTDNMILCCAQIAFLVVALIVWYYFKFPNCFQLNIMRKYNRAFVFRKKGAKNVISQKIIDFFQEEETGVISVLSELNKDVGRWKLIYVAFIHSMLGNREMVILLFTLVLNVLYFATESSMFLVIPTLFIANLTPTLFDIFKAMQMKFSNMITVLLFTYLLVYIFMWFTFFYMADLFTFDDILEKNSEASITESFCFSSIQCFLFMVQQGVRAGGGIGDVIPMVSFQSDPAFFVMRFIYDMLFFILIILVLGNVFLGIIVDTFAELRDQNQSKENDRSNICFICQLSRDACLTRNIDFNKHVSTVHFLWNYVYFLTYLHINNPNDFNRLENSVWERLEDQDFGWIPIEKGAED